MNKEKKLTPLEKGIDYMHTQIVVKNRDFKDDIEFRKILIGSFNIALSEQRKQIREWLNSDKVRKMVGDEVWDCGDADQAIQKILKMFNEVFK